LKVIWSPLALEKLEAAAKFIALDKPPAAENWVNDVFDLTDLLGSQPELGTRSAGIARLKLPRNYIW